MDIVPSELIHNQDVFVREPIDTYSQVIEELNYSKIILTGGRGTGKSALLYQLKNRNIGTLSPYIYTRFEPASLGISKNNSEIFNEDFFKHYYEIILAMKYFIIFKNFMK